MHYMLTYNTNLNPKYSAEAVGRSPDVVYRGLLSGWQKVYKNQMSNYLLIMQNEPNFKNDKIDVSSLTTEYYEEI